MRRINLARAWFLALLIVVPGPPGRAAADNAVDLEVVLSGTGPVTAASFAGRLPRSGDDFGGVLNGSGRTMRVYGHIIGDTFSMTGVIYQLAGGVPGTFEATGSIVDNGFSAHALVHHGWAAVHLRAAIEAKIVGDAAAPATAAATPPQAVPPAPPAAPAEPPPQAAVKAPAQ